MTSTPKNMLRPRHRVALLDLDRAFREAVMVISGTTDHTKESVMKVVTADVDFFCELLALEIEFIRLVKQSGENGYGQV